MAARDTTTERIVRFLATIGIDIVESSLAGPTLLPGVTIDRGRLVVDYATLAWPGDLLHEAGHIAIAPAAHRSRLGANADELDTSDAGEVDAGEVEATAWAWAASVAIGLAPEVLFHDGGYHGKSERLIFTFTSGCYPGAAGLSAAGMTLVGADAKARGIAPYPHMVRWLRE